MQVGESRSTRCPKKDDSYTLVFENYTFTMCFCKSRGENTIVALTLGVHVCNSRVLWTPQNFLALFGGGANRINCLIRCPALFRDGRNSQERTPSCFKASTTFASRAEAPATPASIARPSCCDRITASQCHSVAASMATVSQRRKVDQQRQRQWRHGVTWRHSVAMSQQRRNDTVM